LGAHPLVRLAIFAASKVVLVMGVRRRAHLARQG
jgi:hypothetical protein